MENVRVGLWGFGAMGRGMAKMLLTKKGLDIVAVCDLDPNKVEKSIFEILGVDKKDRKEVLVESD